MLNKIVLISFLFVLSAASRASALPPPENQVLTAPGVVRPLNQMSEAMAQRKVALTIPLTAEPDSEIELAYLELDILAGGARVLRGGTLPKFHSADERFYFMVEPLKGTYRTTLRRSAMESAVSQSLPEASASAKTAPPSELQPMGGPAPVFRNQATVAPASISALEAGGQASPRWTQPPLS